MFENLTDIFDISFKVLTAIYYVVSIFTIFFILLDNKNPSKTVSYIVAIIALPFVGLIIYFLFGRNFRKDKIFSRKEFFDDKKIKEWQRKHSNAFFESELIQEKLLPQSQKIARQLFFNSRAVLTTNNKVDFLINGERKYEALLEDIKNAKNHIHLEYYIIEDGEHTGELFSALTDKVKEGIEVRMLFDSVGSSSLKSSTVRMLKKQGVKVESFMPVFFPQFTSKINYRNHRKIVVIDGKTGYVGGINLSDRYLNEPGEKAKTYWRDSHLRIEGEAVVQLQIQFILNWNFASNEQLTHTDDYFPKQPQLETPKLVQIAASGPDSDWESIMLALFTAIASSSKYVYIQSPYFIPNSSMVNALIAAAQGGVDVRLMIPSSSDTKVTQLAGFSYLRPLLEADVKIYLYTKGFLHAKTVVADDQFTSVGTANMDIRSFYTNFEINAFIYDINTAQKAREIFEDDLKHCEIMNPERWKNRKLMYKILESFARLFSPLL
ncbi:cardiolipin synthase [Salibacter sp.]|uniref:cardiolipin synthase n=1 Tax=Salibacter sp. TaxID=2010995 RepID=UPI0028704BCE|nr:cardiolipin synthase [Salibacter sp.]MDR9487149.1 cardiolipin synthase [Salibacter sp.]